jgi:hypothetical protein
MDSSATMDATSVAAAATVTMMTSFRVGRPGLSRNGGTRSATARYAKYVAATPVMALIVVKIPVAVMMISVEACLTTAFLTVSMTPA